MLHRRHGVANLVHLADLRGDNPPLAITVKVKAGGTMELCVAEKKPTRTADAVGILVLDRFSRVKRGV